MERIYLNLTNTPESVKCLGLALNSYDVIETSQGITKKKIIEVIVNASDKLQEKQRNT